MSSKRIICQSCLRSLRQQWQPSKSYITPLLRQSSTSSQISTPKHSPKRSKNSSPPSPSVTPVPPPPPSSTTATAEPPSPAPTSEAQHPNVLKIAKRLRKTLGTQATETYAAYGSTQRMVKTCIEAGNYTIPQRVDAERKERGEAVPMTEKGEEIGVPLDSKSWWFNEANLPPTFATWTQISFLHLHLLTVRLRAFPPAHAPTWHQHLLNHFFFLAEERMQTQHGMSARGVRHKYLKDMYLQWRGVILAYDEGLVRGDAWLASAVWRNLFRGEENVDLRRVGEVVEWMRRGWRALERLDDVDVAGGGVVFGEPGVRGGRAASVDASVDASVGEGKA
ncbi:MAG: Protein cbp3, mitochondrial [Cirrosporium novae-zelandiae]|nr:MAG: Protein cbp3, mitochondrial [Cirrosporium novae-zelandiae]